MRRVDTRCLFIIYYDAIIMPLAIADDDAAMRLLPLLMP